MDKRKRLRMDILLITLLLAAAGVLYLAFGRTKETGTTAVVRIEGSVVARYSLGQDGVYPLNGGTNILRIENGLAWMQEANCPDHICMQQGKINKTGQVITCLPNLLTVTIEGGEQLVDGVVG